MDKKPIRVLVAEDDDRLRIQYEFVLSDAGYDVVSVPSGEAALDRLKHERYDVVITDLEMNGVMSGVRVAGRKITDYPNTKIIVITGMLGLAHAAIGRQGLPGADATLFKPVEGDELISVLEEVLSE